MSQLSSENSQKVDWLGTAIRVTAADLYQASNSWSKLLFLPEAINCRKLHELLN
jgi:hypothetical protein